MNIMSLTEKPAYYIYIYVCVCVFTQDRELLSISQRHTLIDRHSCHVNGQTTTNSNYNNHDYQEILPGISIVFLYI